MLVKASDICGSEDTYFVKNEKLDQKQRESLKWILDYTLTEARIGDFDFAENTGTYLKPEKLDDFFKKNTLMNFEELKIRLLDLKKIKTELIELRNKNVKKASSDDIVKNKVKKYWDKKIEIQKLLELKFNVKSVDTGANCS